MHIRDEHLKSGTKTRMKRRFQPPTQVKSKPQRQAFGDVVKDVLENTYYRAAPRPEPQPEGYEPVPPSEFQALIQKHVNNASAANDLNLNSDVGTSGRNEGWVKIALHDLFDFNSDAWIRMHEHHLNINFDEELALYDFLDMDAEGEEDTEPREPMAQDILQHGHMD